MLCLNIASLVSLRNSRRKWRSCSISSRTLNRITTQQRKRSCFRETKRKRNTQQAQFTWKSGWERNTQSCSDWATKLCRWTSKTIQRFFWIQKIDSWLTWIKKERDLLCLSTKLWTVTMERWPNGWSTPKIFWLTCSIIISRQPIHLAGLLSMELTPSVQAHQALLACQATLAEEELHRFLDWAELLLQDQRQAVDLVLVVLRRRHPPDNKRERFQLDREQRLLLGNNTELKKDNRYNWITIYSFRK